MFSLYCTHIHWCQLARVQHVYRYSLSTRQAAFAALDEMYYSAADADANLKVPVLYCRYWRMHGGGVPKDHVFD